MFKLAIFILNSIRRTWTIWYIPISRPLCVCCFNIARILRPLYKFLQTMHCPPPPPPPPPHTHTHTMRSYTNPYISFIGTRNVPQLTDWNNVPQVYHNTFINDTRNYIKNGVQITGLWDEPRIEFDACFIYPQQKISVIPHVLHLCVGELD